MELNKVPETQNFSSDAVARYINEIRQALMIRLTEERLLKLFSEGKLFGTIHTCIGQEFVGVAVSKHLRKKDYVFSNHRCHGHYLARYGDIEGLVAEIMGKANGICAGFGGSQHICRDRFYSNGIQGGIVPIATGLGYASKLDESDGISVAYIGDGTLGEGILYESINIASKWEIPLLIVLENNFYSQSTQQNETLAGGIMERFAAFGLECVHSNTWEWASLIEDMGKSIEKVRLQCKPLFHLVDTYRLMAHSKGDDTRSDETVASFRNKDPLNILFEECGEKDWLREMVSEIRRRIDLAIEKAESAAFLDLQPFRDNKLNYTWEEKSLKRQRINSSINEGLHEVLAANNKIHIIGEDIESPYGGAFKVTAGLSAEFPNRVRNTPLSEGAIVGIGNGLALGGYIPVVEIMFGDFITLAADQWINHASKFKGMYNNQVKIPLVIRTPMGGKRGYGPTHSQSIEKLFLGYPDTQVICLHHRYCPALLYKSLFNTIDRPTLVVENKILYTQFVDPDPPSGYQLLHSKTTYPVTWLKPGEKPELTILAIGGMSIDAENAMQQLFEQDEIIAELFLPTLLYPFDTTFLIDSLVQTKKLLIIEEGQSFASLSAEIIAQLAERPDVAGTQFRRVASLSSPIPSSRPLEEKCLPSVTSIIKKALEMMHV